MSLPVPLRHRDFRRFWLGQSVSLVGDQVALFAIPMTAALVLHSGPTQMGLLTAAGLVPSLLFSVHAGSRIDRRGHRRRAMVTTDVLRALLLTSIPAAYLAGLLGLTQLFVVTFLVGTCDVVFAVADAALFPQLVPRDQYVAAQAMINGSRAMSGMLGQGLAGALVATLTAPIALLTDAASFLCSAGFLAAIDPPEPLPSHHGAVRGGISYLTHHRAVRDALCATTTVNFFSYIYAAVFILFATRTLQLPPAMLGMALSIGAVGGLLGAGVTPAISRHIGSGRTFAVGCLTLPASLLLVPAAHGRSLSSLSLVVLSEFGAGSGVMLLDISLGALLALSVPEELRGRVSGAYRTVNYGIRPLGALAGGLLGAAIGLRLTLLIGAAGGTLAILFLLPSPVLAPSPPAPAPGAPPGAAPGAAPGAWRIPQCTLMTARARHPWKCAHPM